MTKMNYFHCFYIFLFFYYFVKAYDMVRYYDNLLQKVNYM